MVVYLLSYILDYYYVRTFSDTFIGIFTPSLAWRVNCLVFCCLHIFVYLCSNNKSCARTCSPFWNVLFGCCCNLLIMCGIWWFFVVGSNPIFHPKVEKSYNVNCATFFVIYLLKLVWQEIYNKEIIASNDFSTFDGAPAASRRERARVAMRQQSIAWPIPCNLSAASSLRLRRSNLDRAPAASRRDGR